MKIKELNYGLLNNVVHSNDERSPNEDEYSLYFDQIYKIADDEIKKLLIKIFTEPKNDYFILESMESENKIV